MPIERKDAENLARDLIREIASEWEQTLFTTCYEENGNYIFLFTIVPGDLEQDGSKIDRPIAPSGFQLNPLAEVTEIIIACFLELENKSIGDEEFRRILAYDNARRWTLRMLDITIPVFQDAMWQSRMIAHTLISIETLKAFGSTDKARELINSTVDTVERKWRDRLGRIRSKRKPKISAFTLNTALRTFLPKFRETGKVPSQNQFAKVVGVTAKGWRTYLTKNKLPKHEVIVRQWLQELVDLYPQ
jgi:hypothetical protein